MAPNSHSFARRIATFLRWLSSLVLAGNKCFNHRSMSCCQAVCAAARGPSKMSNFSPVRWDRITQHSCRSARKFARSAHLSKMCRLKRNVPATAVSKAAHPNRYFPNRAKLTARSEKLNSQHPFARAKGVSVTREPEVRSWPSFEPAVPPQFRLPYAGKRTPRRYLVPEAYRFAHNTERRCCWTIEGGNRPASHANDLAIAPQ